MWLKRRPVSVFFTSQTFGNVGRQYSQACQICSNFHIWCTVLLQLNWSHRWEGSEQWSPVVHTYMGALCRWTTLQGRHLATRYSHHSCNRRRRLPEVARDFKSNLLSIATSQRLMGVLSGVIRANRFARFARIGWFARIGNSSDSCELAWRAIKIGVSIANDSRESIRANRVANRPCH